MCVVFFTMADPVLDVINVYDRFVRNHLQLDPLRPQRVPKRVLVLCPLQYDNEGDYQSNDVVALWVQRGVAE